ncbi:MAG: hypothetical protein G01um101438_943 [Parcubacteria group bacterium Gr01-1014_38]|nr:MAG: hypothetical protein G01um101438_943 [Parcubacteria group bacterium Gr01-1014_38]
MLLLLLLCAFPLPHARAANSDVVPIRWAAFRGGTAGDVDSLRVRAILVNANRYALTTWWKQRGWSRQRDAYLSLGGTDEAHIRPPASEAFALAISLKTGAYDPRKTGVPVAVAKERTLRLVRSLAYRHRANTPGGWGDNWQTALWASSAGAAGWLLWDELSPTDQRFVQRMVEHEAHRFRKYRPPYYRTRAGSIRFPGDSKAEENAWNGRILQLATAMMPKHPRKEIWQEAMIALMLSAFARPADTERTDELHGRPLAEWLNGSNAESNGSVVNQGRTHPDYFTNVTDNVHAALLYTLAGLPIPEAAFFNADVVYAALVNQPFPGGTIYRPGSGEIRYPEGTRWGEKRRMHFALFDVQARAFGFDRKARRRGAYWEPLHTQTVLSMQQRSKDGRTYLTAAEDTYPGREEWVADLAAQAYLTRWLANQGRYAVSPQPKFPPLHPAPMGEES